MCEIGDGVKYPSIVMIRGELYVFKDSCNVMIGYIFVVWCEGITCIMWHKL